MSNFFSTNLKYLREKEKLSQNKLAEKVGVNQTTIARWETEEIKPSIDNVEQIANVLNVSLPDLLISDLRLNTHPPVKEEHEKYKQILKSKGLMDENENIDEESLNKLLKIADMIKGINNKED